jgi:undecaprenyl-diphosphatase
VKFSKESIGQCQVNLRFLKVVLALFLVNSLVEVLMYFRQLFFIFSIFLLFGDPELFAADSNQSSRSAVDSNNSMGYGDALIYGLVEGITEFLPISSTGHLIMVKEVLSSSSEIDEEAINAYLIVIQAGAILAVALLYRNQVFAMILGLLGLDPRGRRLAILVIISFLPAAFLGPLFDAKIEKFLFGILPIAVALFFGAMLMFFAEKRKKRLDCGLAIDTGKNLDDLKLFDALIVGIMQCFAMWPGTSRSMMTIVGGYFVGLKREQAAEFSFLLGLLTLSAAACYKVLTKWEVMEAHLSLGPIAFGCLTAGVSAALSVFWLVGYLSKRGLGIFVWYRIILSMILFVIYFTS